MASIKLVLKKMDCYNSQEDGDEILIWGVMVTSDGVYTTLSKFKQAFTLQGLEIPLDSESSTMTIPIDPNKAFIAKAAIWMIEVDKYLGIYKNGWNVFYDEFRRLYLNRLQQTGNQILAFQQVLPKMNDFIVQKSKYYENHVFQTNEVFDYAQIEHISMVYPIREDTYYPERQVSVNRPDSRYILTYQWHVDMRVG